MLKIHADAALLLVFKVKFISWNVNSLRAREPLVQEIIKREKPDILCLQELKIDDHEYVSNFFLQFNYQTITQTQKSYNGVSISYNQNLDVSDLTFSELNKTQARNNIILLKYLMLPQHIIFSLLCRLHQFDESPKPFQTYY